MDKEQDWRYSPYVPGSEYYNPERRAEIREGAKKLRKQYLRYVETMWFEKILPYIDLFLFDYKATDSSKHKELTGKDNTLIINNLKYICDNHGKVILRCPLVHGVNDSDEHLQGIADISNQYSAIKWVEVMAYHNMGISKSEQIGIKSPITQQTTNMKQKQKWIEELHQKGCKEAVIG